MKQESEGDYLSLVNDINYDEVYLNQVFQYYHERFMHSDIAQEFLVREERVPEKLLDNPLIGLCDRTLGRYIPKARTFEGGAIRGSLQRFGILRATGHELFRGCVIFPSFDDDGHIKAAVGYRIAERIRYWDEVIVYWKKPKPDAFEKLAMKRAKELICGKT
ncbi:MULTISPECIES: hypothetical protein [unclassified Pseudoalteromonas]|uniref:hypothetical protein n=1 Tax=unclassified Pseudoalteromonas TaxID=194690 RepID=UPI0030151349